MPGASAEGGGGAPGAPGGGGGPPNGNPKGGKPGGSMRFGDGFPDSWDEEDEAKHPRAEDGRFGEKSGGGTAVAEEEAPVRAGGQWKGKNSRSAGGRSGLSLKEAVEQISEEWGFKPKDVRDAITFVHGEKLETMAAREEAKRAIREALDINLQDIKRVENGGYDHASAHKMDGNTSNGRPFKRVFAKWDEKAQQAARSYPDLIGDPDDQGADFGAAMWELLREGVLLNRRGKEWILPKGDDDVLHEAVELLKVHARSRAPSDEEEREFGSDVDSVPLGRWLRWQAFLARGTRWSVDFDEAKHPRADDGKFGKKGGGSVPAARYKPGKGQGGFDFEALDVAGRSKSLEVDAKAAVQRVSKNRKARAKKKKDGAVRGSASEEGGPGSSHPGIWMERGEKFRKLGVGDNPLGVEEARKRVAGVFESSLEKLGETDIDKVRGAVNRQKAYKAAKFRKASELVEARLSDGVMQKLAESAREHHWSTSVDEVSKKWNKAAGHPKGTKRCGGFYDPQALQVHSDGDMPDHTMAHEVAHALDWFPRSSYKSTSGSWQSYGSFAISGTKEWNEAWESEINAGTVKPPRGSKAENRKLETRKQIHGKLTDRAKAAISGSQFALSAYATSEPIEGWAEFGRLAILDQRLAAEKFPKCYKIWEECGFSHPDPPEGTIDSGARRVRERLDKF